MGKNRIPNDVLFLFKNLRDQFIHQHDFSKAKVLAGQHGYSINLLQGEMYIDFHHKRPSQSVLRAILDSLRNYTERNKDNVFSRMTLKNLNLSYLNFDNTKS